ncbi:MAG TPA: SPOR domain-containing protein [Myxococcales bacterium]|jgi:cell division septation protein DedD
MRDSHRMHDGIDLHLDNRQIAAFVIASLVVAGAVFSVGVLVGKQLAVASTGPAKPGDALAAIDEKEKARTPESVTGVGEVPTPKPDALNYQKELTKPSTASAAIEPTKPATAKAEDKAEPKKEEAKKDEPTKPATAKADDKAEPKKEEAKKVEPKKEEAKKKESLSAAFDKASKTDEGAGEEAGFTLQVASLPSKEEADKLVDRLTSKGLKPYVVEADVPSKGHVFRVRSGTYATREEAETGLKAFKKKSALPAIIANR